MKRKTYQKKVRQLLTAIYQDAKQQGKPKHELKKLALGISAKNVKPDFTKVRSYAEAWENLKPAREVYGLA